MTIARLGLVSVLLAACSSGGSAGPGTSDAGMDRAADVSGAAGGGGNAGGTGGAAAGTAGGGSGGAAAGTAGGGSGGAAGATGGGGGTAGSAGVAGSGGATAGAGGATAGSGGATGAAGTGGSRGGAGGATAGSGGAAGSRGGSGGGGGGGSGGGAGTTASSLWLEYQNSSATATTFGVRLINIGPATPLISTIKVRYYFLDDTTNRDATPMVTAAQWQIASPSSMINLRSTGGCSVVASFVNPPQMSYADFGCNLGSPMNVQDALTFSITIDPATQLAANDYSYAATAGAFMPNDRMLLILNGVVVAGTPP